jgi:hypothetical protein
MRLRESTEGRTEISRKAQLINCRMVRREASQAWDGWLTETILPHTNQTQKHFSLDNIIQSQTFLSINNPIEIMSVTKMPRILSRILED